MHSHLQTRSYSCARLLTLLALTPLTHCVYDTEQPDVRVTSQALDTRNGLDDAAAAFEFLVDDSASAVLNPNTKSTEVGKSIESKPTIGATAGSGSDIVSSEVEIGLAVDWLQPFGPRPCTEMPALGPMPEQTLPMHSEIGPDGEVYGRSVAELAGVPSKMWNAGQTLRVQILGGTEHMRSRVRHYANVWTETANIHFEFVDGGASEIRVAFGPVRDGGWSYVGREALGVSGPTVQLGLVDTSTESEFSRLVLHEFGHALGFIHEHQSPAAGIPWNREAVYSYYARVHHWRADKVDRQIFDRYAVTSTNYSAFDRDSIMLYAIDPTLTLDGSSTPRNTELSATDREYSGRWYPYPTNTAGELRTGDDCDQVEFTIEHDVVASHQIEFTLQPGARVTWWKAIAIPVRDSRGTVDLWMQDGSYMTQTLPRDLVDDTRSIAFAKAKVFGVHTWLSYHWDVLSALPGGTRVVLTWIRDAC